MAYEDLSELLLGYEDPKVKEYAIRPIGVTGINSRLFYIFYLHEYRTVLHRLEHRAKLMKVWGEVYRHSMYTAGSALLTEIVRIMDHEESMGKKNLTIPHVHSRFQMSTDVSPAEKAAELSFYSELDAHYESEQYRKHRNKMHFHLDLDENLNPTVMLGGSENIVRLILSWFTFVGTVVSGREPLFITTRSFAFGKEQARALRHMMLDCVRFHKTRATKRRFSLKDIARYGFLGQNLFYQMEEAAGEQIRDI